MKRWFGLTLVVLVLAGCGGADSATIISLPPFEAAGTAVLAQPESVFATPDPNATHVPLMVPNLPGASGRLITSDDLETAHLVTFDGSFPVTLTDSIAAEYQATWSHTYDRIIDVHPCNRDISCWKFVVAAADGTNPRELAQITAPEPEGLLNELAWSPDDTRVASIWCRTVYDDQPDRCAIYVVDVATGAARIVVEAEDIERDTFAWSPDGRRIAFTADSFKAEPKGIWIVDVDSGKRHQLTTHSAYEMFWLRDGSIIYEADCDQQATTHVCQVNADSGHDQPLYRTAEPEILRLLSISPDERWLHFTDGVHKAELLLDRTTGLIDVAQIPAGTDFSFSDLWSPDSRSITFYDAMGGVTYVYEVGSGKPLQPLINERVLVWLP